AGRSKTTGALNVLGTVRSSRRSAARARRRIGFGRAGRPRQREGNWERSHERHRLKTIMLLLNRGIEELGVHRVVRDGSEANTRLSGGFFTIRVCTIFFMLFKARARGARRPCRAGGRGLTHPVSEGSRLPRGCGGGLCCPRDVPPSSGWPS